jgi:pimeloyl-ACP methyl ester carboxylesterase
MYFSFHLSKFDIHLIVPEYRAFETYNFKRSIGRQGPALEVDVTVLAGAKDVFAGGENVLNKWRESTSGDCIVQIFANAGHFYWKHSDEYEERFLESIMEKLFPVEGLQFDQKFLEVASVVSLDDTT